MARILCILITDSPRIGQSPLCASQRAALGGQHGSRREFWARGTTNSTGTDTPKGTGKGLMTETRGRPSTFSQELANAICECLAEGMTLREACRQEGMPKESTVRRWALDDREGFAAQYTRAREIGYHVMADELLEISDSGENDWMRRNGEDGEAWQVNGEHIQRSRLRVDTRKWMLSKALPKVYGDKLDVQHGGKVTVNLPDYIRDI